MGKYGVDVNGFEIFLEQLPFSTLQAGLVMIDEIGKMECLSDRFAEILKTIFESNSRLVATIALKGSGLIAQLKRRPDIRLFELTRENQDELFNIICSHIETLE